MVLTGGYTFTWTPFYLASLLYLLGTSCQAQTFPRITFTTPLGQLTGRLVTVGGQTVNQFRGIPYARPPTGNMRFQKPVAAERWKDTLDATQFRPSCPQPDWGANMGVDMGNISEDCLHLNIYTTYLPSQSRTPAPKAVMVWVHGGGFVAGAGRGADGTLMAIRGDVVVVTINYRLGMLGWLYTHDDVSAGNYGLWDQRMAFIWVRDNIAAFGGDPNQITIFGESAGGYSVGLHTLVPLNKGLFQRAIMQSGTALNPRTIAFDPVTFTHRVASILGCQVTDHRGMVDCVKGKSVEEILTATGQAEASDTLQFVFNMAVVDGELVQSEPRQLLGQDYREKVPFWRMDVMVGTNSAEGSLLLGPLQPWTRQLNFDPKEGIPTHVLCGNISTALARDYYNGSSQVARAICSQYTSSDGGAEEQARQVVNMYGDMMFQMAAVDTLELHVKGKEAVEGRLRGTYQYLFSHTPVSISERQNQWFRGAPHGGEVAFVLERDHLAANETDLSDAMIRGWTNFAKFGTPNDPNKPTGTFQWPEYDLTTRAYTNLDLTVTSEQHLYPQRMDFWRKQVPELLLHTDNGASKQTGQPWATVQLMFIIQGFVLVLQLS